MGARPVLRYPIRMTFIIRTATAGDAATIAEHNARLALESEGKSLDPAAALAGVQAAIADPECKGYYYLACAGAELAGQCQITREWSDWRNAWFWWFQSVYTRPEHRGQGVFRALHDFVRERAIEAGDVLSLRLYVEKANRSARQTYERLGLQLESYDVMHEILRPGNPH